MKKTFIYILILGLFAPLSASAQVSGCAEGYKFNIFTGKPCTVVIEEPQDCLEGHKFSIFTGQPCADTVGELLAKVEQLEQKVKKQEERATVVVPETPKERKAIISATVSNGSLRYALEASTDPNATFEVILPNGFEIYHNKKQCSDNSDGTFKWCTTNKIAGPINGKSLTAGTYSAKVITYNQEYDIVLVKGGIKDTDSVNIEVF